jgi:hypothetical protein
MKVRTIQETIKATARTVVALDKKVAAPLPPNTAPERAPPPPKALAKPSPLADCISTVIINETLMIT